MRITLIFILSALGFILFAQEKPAKLQIGLNFSSDYCYRSLKNNDGSTSSTAVINMRNRSEKAKLSFTSGLNVVYNVKDKLGIETGIQYSNKGYRYRFNMRNLAFNSEIDPEAGINNRTAEPTSMMEKMVYNYHYLDIPLKANAIFGEKKIRFIASAGFTTNIFIKATTTILGKNEDGKRSRKVQATTFDFKNVNISPLLSAGVDWQFKSGMNLRIEPTLRYGLLKIIDTPVTGYLWNMGLNMGCYYSL